ncbi:FAD-dependent oxidoreductase [Conexibacter sp. CPCC 206217]|uniref:FAD-dependent oxidoreductase n=1 Tax=Conexibacter sp. CPCC 206217 TaxID=3064574 RepID=UPI0027166D4A|nr:FAD-dependent oxidoreductase [Conexibacter sp. CPCC 206217]MDO8212558.1 FAD-dependent oxidoreductase [Conexibacter sp. CPCC 206217]
MSVAPARRIVVAGGGVGAIEALLALHRLLAGAVELTLLAPERAFVYRPLAVAEPFTGAAPPSLPLAEIAAEHGAAFVHDALEEVDPQHRIVTTRDGARLPYDALVLALGARPQPVPRGAIRFGDPRDVPAVAAVVEGVRAGRVRRIALTAAGGEGWTLPLYELALGLAAEHDRQGRAPAVFVVTPEEQPLGVFGADAAQRVTELLDEHGVQVLTAGVVERFDEGVLWIEFEGALDVDAAIALPRLHGPAPFGIVHDGAGFVPVDEHSRARGQQHVYAVGDMCADPVKQGGLAAQRADAAAAHIAWRHGAAPAPAPFHPILRSVLLTGGRPRYLRADLTGAAPEDGVFEQPPWWPPAKIAARELAPYLAERLLERSA